jgi:hypothetical protein
MGSTPKVNKIAHTKKRLLEALEESLGVVTDACKIADVSRSAFYGYYNDDAEFKAAVDSIDDMAIDFAESQLHKQIKDGVPVSTIFYLKTRGKKRGYVEKQEVDHTTKGEKVNFGVQITMPSNGREVD